jgi:hypothetical protein
LDRRRFLKGIFAATSGGLAAYATGRRVPRILLSSSWQAVNAGDIAHTPGVLALIEKHIPGAEVLLWASSNLSAEPSAMEQKRFPGLGIVKGTSGPDEKASNADLADALDSAREFHSCPGTEPASYKAGIKSTCRHK